MDADSNSKPEHSDVVGDPRDRRIAQLEAENAGLRARLDKLEQLLAERERGNKRQAAPFSKGPPRPEPKTPGRKPGDGYGNKAFRAIPDSRHIDEVHDAPLPDKCPRCGGGSIDLVSVEHQYQAELPRRPIYRRFNVAVGRCGCCKARVQGRHALQTSNALGCCASQLGPEAQAFAVILNKTMGLSHGKVAAVFGALQFPLTPGGACQAMLRAARRTEPARDRIVEHIQGSRQIVPDETGWRIGGKMAWLHTAVGDDATAYLVHFQRGYEAAIMLISEDYAGTLTHDGWSPYDKFDKADHQTCLEHLIRRCDAMLELCKGKRGAAAALPRKIRMTLMEGLSVRDRRDAGEIKPATAARLGKGLLEQMVKLTECYKSHAGNERLSKHIWNHQDQLFTFLKTPGVDATNWRAEQAIRPAVVNRKVWGGNRTEEGAWAQGVLLTVLETARRRGVEVLDWLSGALRAWPRETPMPGSMASG